MTKEAFRNIYKNDPDQFMKKAKQIVLNYYDTKQSGFEVKLDNLYVVWFSKTLQNWKALLASDKPEDSLYFEVTYNGDKEEAYLDVYAKISNEAISDH